jgi:hypothetical protein
LFSLSTSGLIFLDVCGVCVFGDYMILALSDHGLKIYQWRVPELVASIPQKVYGNKFFRSGMPPKNIVLG